MKPFGRGSRAHGLGRRLCVSGSLLAVAFLFIALGARVRQEQDSAAAAAENRWTCRYDVSAHVILLGNLADVGTMTIESARQKNDGRLIKTLRIAGSSNPEQVKKKRDYRGEFNVLKIHPLGPDDSADERAEGEWMDVESSSSGFLKLNEKYESEKIAFFPDHAVSTRHDGTETWVEGSYGSILSPLEYLLEHEINVGETIDMPFILNAIPRVFRMEVAKLTTLIPFKSRAFEINIQAVEKITGVDKAPQDVWRKKGNLKIWFCKDGPYRNRVLRMKIKFRWFLWLQFDLQKPVTG